MHVIIDGILLFLLLYVVNYYMYAWYDYLSVCKWLQTNIHSICVDYACCRFMKTPDKLSALRNARNTIRKHDRKIEKIKVRLESLTSTRGIAVESNVQEEITQIIQRESPVMESLPAFDFRRIFWKQQV